ncbi:uncharacterized protein AMSG_01079 [Thecamonas trahens ATCC 50062]|uniref:F-box domain-containing protein n=1 Tax=Thecamonas trahens ATCC 50062 TaxID=461836 RepID=A0A0L0DJ67_THETB|nr:hypothetical protein AMSG_01079 [Thecamonas trahens ATCC 50062]KNC52250.1 hypothetical protein AMSG_01079 [Thecamonas trahens ATCC 50062]|eukprot:XP_013762252.1 hypothetical protein AMSG_01079 [Thecamonas trahens ATCC 50062]
MAASSSMEARWRANKLCMSGMTLHWFVTALWGGRADLVKALVTSGRVAVDGEVVTDPEARLVYGIEDWPEKRTVTIKFPSCEPQDVPCPFSASDRAAFVCPTRPYVSVGTRDDDFLAEVLTTAHHPYVLAVEAALRELGAAWIAGTGARSLFRMFTPKSSFHRKIVHCLASRFGMTSTTLEDQADDNDEQGYWCLDFCYCCYGNATHDFEWEGWHVTRSVIPVKVTVASYSDDPPSVSGLLLRRGGGVRPSRPRSPSSGEVSDGGSSALSLLDMPDELLLAILGWLDVPDLLRASGACRVLRRIAADNTLWFDLFKFYVARDVDSADVLLAACKAFHTQRSHTWRGLYIEAKMSGSVARLPGSGVARVTSRSERVWAAASSKKRRAAMEAAAARGVYRRYGVASGIHEEREADEHGDAG